LRLDAHQFFTPEHTPEHLASILKRNRFEGSIAVAQNVADTDWLIGQAARHGFIRGVVAHVRDCEKLGALRSPVCGVTGDISWPIEAFEELASAGLAVDLECGLERIPPLASRVPSLRIAIVHMGRPDGSTRWWQAIDEAAAFPNVWCKASGLLAAGMDSRAAVRHALHAFGPSRLMFGSDWPSCLPADIWKATLAVFTQAIGAQPVEIREELLGGAAGRFYSIQESALENGYNEVSSK
jgi:predicted TIM-barrel fold metal-dependent hydrolase